VDPGRRRELKRYAAPVAFLAAATIAVLLIKSGLRGHSTQAPTITAPTTSVTTTKRHKRKKGTTTTAQSFYTIASGDTLGSVAFKQHTTVAQLLQLNPGIDPTALHVGQRIRVR
jgi:LysM repeat protein